MAKYWKPSLVFKPPQEESIRRLAHERQADVQDMMRDAVLALLKEGDQKQKVLPSTDQTLADGIKSLHTLMKTSPSAAKALCEAITAITKELDCASHLTRRPRGGKITAALDQLDAEIEATERET